MTDSTEPYLVEVGTVTLKEPYEFRENSENATWFRDYVFGPGTYPLYAKIVGDQVALVSSPATAVVFASDDPHEIGSSKAMRVPVFPKDVFDGRISLDFTPTYADTFEVSDQNPYGVKTFIGNSTEPAWKHLIDSAKIHYFTADLFEYNQKLRDYASDNGFLKAPKAEIGMNMGASRYEWVIRAEQAFKALSGHSFDRYSIPLHEVKERFETKQGSAKDMAKAVAQEIIEDFKIPLPPNKPAEKDMSPS